MSGYITSLAPGIAWAVAMPPLGVDERVERARARRASARGPGAGPTCGRGWRRWPSSGGRRPRGGSCGRTPPRPAAGRRRRRSAARRSAGTSRRRCRRRRRGVRTISFGSLRSSERLILPCLRSPVFDMIDVRLATLAGVADGQRLADHPAHRHADDVGPVDAEVVEQAGGVVGHVADGVAGLGEPPGDASPGISWRRVGGGVRHHRRQPDVAVVEADHPEAPGHEPVDELQRPRRRAGRRGPSRAAAARRRRRRGRRTRS